MAGMTPEQWRQYADQWKKTGAELERIRRAELANREYDLSTIESLLDLGARAPRREEHPNGLVEMQKVFMAYARRQGLLPDVVREEGTKYIGEGQDGRGES